MAYIPNALVAVVIRLVGIVLGSFVFEVVEKAVKASKMGGERLLPALQVGDFSVLVHRGLQQRNCISTLTDHYNRFGRNDMMPVAAFGLGGQEHAKSFEQVMK